MIPKSSAMKGKQPRVSAAFAGLRRQRGSLLISFNFLPPCTGFACGFSSPVLARCAGRTFYARLRGAVDYVILIPAIVVLHFPGSAKTI
jgi:hypothetical protein